MLLCLHHVKLFKFRDWKRRHMQNVAVHTRYFGCVTVADS